MSKFQQHPLTPIFALATAGALWGLTVPLSKLSLAWLAPAWLTAVRFLIAAPALAFAGRRGLRAALTLPIAGAGALGFGAVLVLQNAGIERTSVSQAALLIGAVPVLVALLAAARGQATRRPLIWLGYGLALTGIALVAGGGGGGASAQGDLLVFASATLSALFIYVQPRLLGGRDPAAVTAVQLGAGMLVALPLALIAEPAPSGHVTGGLVAAVGSLALVGTVLPFWLFAYGQSRVSPRMAGAYVNLEPVVGAAVGWAAFGDPATVIQVLGALGVLAGIALSGLPEGPEAASDEHGREAAGRSSECEGQRGEGRRPDGRRPSLRLSLSWRPAGGS